MKLVNAKEMSKQAFAEGWAVPHINTNNLFWTKAILLAAEKNKSPVIVGVSEGAVKWMGGFHTVVDHVAAMTEEMGITVPVVMHLDHGSYEGALKALDAGFTSVMFDGSHFPYEENIVKATEVIRIAKEKNASVEVEVGTLAGVEDGVTGSGEVADPKEVAGIAELGPDMIAAGINNIHGQYPEGWEGLRFDVLANLKAAAGRSIVLHGGSGIPEDQIKKAISMGVGKVNVNTELQLAFAEATREFVRSGKSDEGKNFDPRKFLQPGIDAMIETVTEKMIMFGSAGKAK